MENDLLVPKYDTPFKVIVKTFMDGNETSFVFLYFVWINYIFTWNYCLFSDRNYRW